MLLDVVAMLLTVIAFILRKYCKVEIVVCLFIFCLIIALSPQNFYVGFTDSDKNAYMEFRIENCRLRTEMIKYELK